MKKRFSSSPKPTLGKGTWGLGHRGSRAHQYLIPFAAWARLKPSSSHASPPPDPIVVSWPDHLRPMTSGPSVTEARSPVTDLILDRVTRMPGASPRLPLLITICSRLIMQLFFNSENPPPAVPLQHHCHHLKLTLLVLRVRLQTWRIRGLILGLSSHQECIWRKCQTDRQWSMW